MKYVLGKIKIELSLVLIYSVSFWLIHYFYEAVPLTIPVAIPAIIGTIISLLLAFKSNQAYDRWWEARIVWGAIVNDSRSLLRQVVAFYKDPDFSDEANRFKEQFAKRQAAWCFSLANRLRGKDSLKPVKEFLDEDEFHIVKRHKHIPNALLLMHSKELTKATEKGRLNTFQQVEIDNTLTRLCDSMGKAERIKNTIFPTTYSMYIRFTLCLFVMLLPFGMVEDLGWLMIPVVTTMGAAFFLIEKMAIHLQDPFENRPTDTPMTVISNNIHKDLLEMVNEFREEYEHELQRKMPHPTPAMKVKQPYFVL
ncbi:bestrophin family protein [Flavobacterium agri]|nr:bestrophin family ion channel [Flavobacterium agri]